MALNKDITNPLFKRKKKVHFALQLLKTIRREDEIIYHRIKTRRLVKIIHVFIKTMIKRDILILKDSISTSCSFDFYEQYT